MYEKLRFIVRFIYFLATLKTQVTRPTKVNRNNATTQNHKIMKWRRHRTRTSFVDTRFFFFFLVLRCQRQRVSATVRCSYTQLHHRKMCRFVEVFCATSLSSCRQFCVSPNWPDILIARMDAHTHTCYGSTKMSIWVRECITKYCFTKQFHWWHRRPGASKRLT